MGKGQFREGSAGALIPGENGPRRRTYKEVSRRRGGLSRLSSSPDRFLDYGSVSNVFEEDIYTKPSPIGAADQADTASMRQVSRAIDSSRHLIRCSRRGSAVLMEANKHDVGRSVPSVRLGRPAA